MARIRLAIVAVACVVAIFGQTAVAAGAAGPSGVSFRNSGLSASYSFFPVDPSMPQINITVSQSSNVTRPLGGPPTTTSETNLNLSTFDGVNFSSGCFKISTTPTIAADLSSASLHVTVTDATPDCGFPNSIVLPETVDVTWTGTGPVNSFHATGHTVCGSFHEDSVHDSSNSPATAVAAVSPLLNGTFPSSQGNAISSGSNLTLVEGTAPPLCEPQGGPGGGGPVTAGTYRHTAIGASQQFSDASGTSIELAVGTISNSANPRVGPSTSSTQTTVNMRLFGPSGSGFGCFVVTDPGAFTVNQSVSSASLHTTLTDSNAPCGPFPNSFASLPVTLDVSWTGIGQTTTTVGNVQRSCLTFHSVSSSTTITNNSSAVAALSGAINETFVSQQSANESTGTIGSQNSTTQVVGVQAGGC